MQLWEVTYHSPAPEPGFQTPHDSPRSPIVNRSLRLGMTVLVAGILVGAAVAFNLGLLGRGGLNWPGEPRQPPTATTSSPTVGADEYSVMGVYHTGGRDIPSPRLVPAEPALIDLLIASGMDVKRVDPMNGGHSVFGIAVVHRLSMSPQWVLFEATSFGPGLVPPLDNPACSASATGYRVVLAGFTLALNDQSAYRFGSLRGSVVWTSDTQGWKRVSAAGAKEIFCTTQ
jgi:hypothetical protein